MLALLNFIGYEAVWFMAVIGAGAGWNYPGVVAAAVFATVQLSVSRMWSADLQLAGAALLVGMLADGLLAHSHLLRYAAASTALPPGGAPVWILSLWVAFALTLNHSLKWVVQRPPLAICLGVCGGPLAYLAAARVAAAVQFSPPAWRALAILATQWAAAMALFCILHRLQARAPAQHAAVAP